MKKRGDFQAIAKEILAHSGIFSAAFEATPQPMCLLLPDETARGGARFLAMNAAAKKAHGVPAEKVVGLDAASVFPPKQPDGQDSPPLVCALIDDTEKDEVFHPRIRLRRQDGHEWDAECSAHSVTVAGRRLVIVNPKDISDRLMAEDALRESESRFRRLFLQAPVCIALADLNGRYTQANPAFCSMLGYTEKELTGKTFADVSPRDDAAKGMLNKSAMIKGELDVYDTEKRYVHKDGRIIWVHLRVSPLRDKNGKPQSFLVVSEDITWRRKAEAALRESEEKFRGLFSQSPIPTTLGGFDGEILQANPAYCRLLGMTEEKIIGRNYSDWTHPDDMAASVEASRKLLKGEIKTHQRETRHIRQDGTTRWVNLHVSLIRDAAGKPKCFLALLEDISSRRKAEVDLRESEEKFRRLFSESPTSIALTALDGRFIQNNPAFCRLLGYSEEELKGKRFAELTHPDDAANNVEAAKGLAQGKIKLYETDKRYIRKDGDTVWVHMRVTALRDGKGTPQCFLATFEDITWRRKMEEKLSESEEKFRRFFEQSPVGIATLRKDLSIFQANPAFAKMLGYTIAELLKMSMPDISIPDKALKENKKQIKRVLKGEIPFFQIDKRYRHKDGSTIWARVMTSSIRDRNGKALYILGMVEDISWSRQAERVLRERERLALAGEIATGIAHEINNPLNIILGLAEVASSEHKLPAKARRDLASIAAHAKRAGAVTRGLLQFGRRTKPSTEMISLGEILDTTVTLVAPDLKKSKIKLAVRKPKKLVRVCVDPNQLQQALINLVLNAKQALAGRPRRKISLDAGKSGEFGFIRVTDTGPGIPKKIAHRIFEPFFTTRPPGEGSGLGLAISQNIAAENAGRLTVSSSKKGAVFTLELPLRCFPGRTSRRKAQAQRT